MSFKDRCLDVFGLIVGDRRLAWLSLISVWAIIIAGVVILLTGCATKPTARLNEPEAKVDTVKVGVAVRASCVPVTLGPEPQYVDTDQALKAAPGAAERLLILGAGRKQRIARSGEVEPVIDKCR